MMLHRHFDNGNQIENMTRLDDVSRPAEGEDFVSEVFPPESSEPSKRGRKKKTEE